MTIGSQKNTISVTIYGNNAEFKVRLPARWVICSACEGSATTTSHIEADGGGFTADEFDRACYEHEDFADKYFGGEFDRPCEACKGLGRIHVVDRDAVKGWRNKIFLRALDDQARSDREFEAISAAERRMGA